MRERGRVFDGPKSLGEPNEFPREQVPPRNVETSSVRNILKNVATPHFYDMLCLPDISCVVLGINGSQILLWSVTSRPHVSVLSRPALDDYITSARLNPYRRGHEIAFPSDRYRALRSKQSLETLFPIAAPSPCYVCKRCGARCV